LSHFFDNTGCATAAETARLQRRRTVKSPLPGVRPRVGNAFFVLLWEKKHKFVSSVTPGAGQPHEHG